MARNYKKVRDNEAITNWNKYLLMWDKVLANVVCDDDFVIKYLDHWG